MLVAAQPPFDSRGVAAAAVVIDGRWRLHMESGIRPQTRFAPSKPLRSCARSVQVPMQLVSEPTQTCGRGTRHPENSNFGQSDSAGKRMQHQDNSRCIFKGVCDKSDRLHHLPSLKDFLTLINTTDDSLSAAVFSLLPAHKATLEDAAAEQLLQNGAWLDDQEGEVLDLRVIRVDADVEDVALLRISDTRAVVDLPLMFTYEADLQYPDPNFTFYDKEDHKTYHFGDVEATVEDSTELRGEFEISFSATDEPIFEIFKVVLGSNDPLPVSADPEAAHFYK